jgi:hypothetical protein
MSHSPKTRVHKAGQQSQAVHITYEMLVEMIDALPPERRHQLAMAMIQTSLEATGNDAFYGEIASKELYVIMARGKRGQQLKELTHKFVADSFEENTKGYVNPTPPELNG